MQGKGGASRGFLLFMFLSASFPEGTILGKEPEKGTISSLSTE